MSTMASAFVIPPEIIDFRPVMKNVDEYIMVLEMRCKKETFTVISLPLELCPEGWVSTAWVSSSTCYDEG